MEKSTHINSKKSLLKKLDKLEDLESPETTLNQLKEHYLKTHQFTIEKEIIDLNNSKKLTSLTGVLTFSFKNTTNFSVSAYGNCAVVRNSEIEEMENLPSNFGAYYDTLILKNSSIFCQESQGVFIKKNGEKEVKKLTKSKPMNWHRKGRACIKIWKGDVIIVNIYDEKKLEILEIKKSKEIGKKMEVKLDDRVWHFAVFSVGEEKSQKKDWIITLNYEGYITLFKIDFSRLKILCTFKTKIPEYLSTNGNFSGQCNTIAVCPKGKFVIIHDRTSSTKSLSLRVFELNFNKLELRGALEMDSNLYRELNCLQVIEYIGDLMMIAALDSDPECANLRIYGFDVRRNKLFLFEELNDIFSVGQIAKLERLEDGWFYAAGGYKKLVRFKLIYKENLK